MKWNIVLVLLLLIGLVGCVQADPHVTTEPPVTTTEPTTAPTEPTTAPTEPATVPTTQPTEPDTSLQPAMPAVGKERRQLTTAEIEEFRKMFYPDVDEPMWYNFALCSRYATAADVNLLNLLYSAPMEEMTQADIDFYGPTEGYIHKYPISVMNEALLTCFGITLDETNMIGIEEMRYNEAGQCYYHDHGDPLIATPKFFDGYVNPDGTVELYYNGYYDLYTLGDGPTIVTMKYVGNDGQHHWHILSNLKATTE